MVSWSRQQVDSAYSKSIIARNCFHKQCKICIVNTPYRRPPETCYLSENYGCWIAILIPSIVNTRDCKRLWRVRTFCMKLYFSVIADDGSFHRKLSLGRPRKSATKSVGHRSSPPRSPNLESKGNKRWTTLSVEHQKNSSTSICKYHSYFHGAVHSVCIVRSQRQETVIVCDILLNVQLALHYWIQRLIIVYIERTAASLFSDHWPGSP